MDLKHTPSASGFRTSLHGLPYDQTVADRLPISITTTPSPSPSPSSISITHDPIKPHPFPQPTYVSAKSTLQPEKDSRRDSGLATSSVRNSRTTVNSDLHSVASLKSAKSLPHLRPEAHTISVPPRPHSPPPLPPPPRRDESPWLSLKRTKSTSKPSPPDEPFCGIAIDLPSVDLRDDLQLEKMEFSKRGSMLLGGQKVKESRPQAKSNHLQAEPANGRLSSKSSVRKRPFPKILSTDEELLSEKVRSHYETGHASDNEPDSVTTAQQDHEGLRQGTSASSEKGSRRRATSILKADHATAPQPLDPQHGPRRELQAHELAGGIEDWQDIESGEVDRYGFIMPRSSTKRLDQPGGEKQSLSTRDHPTLQRVSTSLQLATEAPRRKRTIRRAPSGAKSTRSVTPSPASTRQPTPSTARPASAHALHHRGNLAGGGSRLRQVANRLPQNRDRRFMDEAADMLTLPFGLSDIGGTSEVDAKDSYMRAKEMERMEKWRRMAKVVSNPTDGSGSGTRFEFDTRSPKLAERTWKGIPDRWRSTAWHAFLSASAKNSKESLSDRELIELFHEYQSQASPDDVQIDIDVPRTVSSHIMFRRRYRGGAETSLSSPTRHEYPLSLPRLRARDGRLGRHSAGLL